VHAENCRQEYDHYAEQVVEAFGLDVNALRMSTESPVSLIFEEGRKQSGIAQ